MSAGVVVGVDGSYGSSRALARALHEASRLGCELTVVHVWQPWVWVEGMVGTGLFATSTTQDARVQAEQLVSEEVAKALTEVPDPNAVRVRTVVQEGDAGRVLSGLSDGAHLLVLGRSGRGHLAGAVLGSTVRYALHHAQVPVLVVPDPGAPTASCGRVVVGFDSASSSAAALRWGLAMARRESCPLVVVHAWSTADVPRDGALSEVADLQRAATQALSAAVLPLLGDTHSLRVTLDAAHGRTTATLLAETRPDDLLVVGARGSGGFRHLLLGSVAAQLAEHAPCTLAVVR